MIRSGDITGRRDHGGKIGKRYRGIVGDTPEAVTEKMEKLVNTVIQPDYRLWNITGNIKWKEQYESKF